MPRVAISDLGRSNMGKVNGVQKTLQTLKDLMTSGKAAQNTLNKSSQQSTSDEVFSKMRIVDNHVRALTSRLADLQSKLSNIDEAHLSHQGVGKLRELRTWSHSYRTDISRLVDSLKGTVVYWNDIVTTTRGLENKIAESVISLGQTLNKFSTQYMTSRLDFTEQDLTRIEKADTTVETTFARDYVKQAESLIDEAESEYAILQQAFERYQRHGWGPSKDVTILDLRREIDVFRASTAIIERRVHAAETYLREYKAATVFNIYDGNLLQNSHSMLSVNTDHALYQNEQQSQASSHFYPQMGEGGQGAQDNFDWSGWQSGSQYQDN